MSGKLDNLIKEVNNSNFASIRGVISKIFEILNNSKSTVNDLENIIKLDPPLAVKVLKVANSAFYASRVEFNDLKEAVLWIGFDEIKNIALTEQLFKIFNTENNNFFSRKELWKNSIATALLAKMIYRREYGEKGENIYTAGLIHNIGIIIIDQFLNEDFHKILEYREKEKKDHIQSENKFLAFNHSDIAGLLADNWNFPEELKLIIQNHHSPEKLPANLKKESEILYIADYYCKILELGYSDNIYSEDEEIFKKYLKNNNIEVESLELMRPDLLEKIKNLEDIGLLSNGKN